jgi:hypothetical protein
MIVGNNSKQGINKRKKIVFGHGKKQSLRQFLSLWNELSKKICGSGVLSGLSCKFLVLTVIIFSHHRSIGPPPTNIYIIQHECSYKSRTRPTSL